RVTVYGDEVIDVHGSTPLIPASTMKLLTSSAALDILRANHVYTTSVPPVGAPVSGVITGDVWLVGGGDPLLATQDYVHTFRRPPEPATALEALAGTVLAAGVTQRHGPLL